MIGKETRRGLIIAVFLASFVICIWVILEALIKNEWGTVAGALAVIAAIISAAMSQPILWKQEDDAEPDLNILFDLDSRAHIIQLRLVNNGGSNAYDVKIEWNKPIINIFKEETNFPYIPVMVKNEMLQILIDSTTKTFEKAKEENKELTFDGYIIYKINKTNKNFKKKYFEISLEQSRKKVSPATDSQDFLIHNKNISKELKALNENIKELIALVKNQQ